MAVTLSDIRKAAKSADLSGRLVCVHASLRSFGWVDGGAQTVIDGLLAEGCTVLVLTLTYAYASAPPPDRRPARNGVDYERYAGKPVNVGPVYAPDSNEIERQWMGAIPTAVLAMPERVRGNHPRGPFAAVGPLATELVAAQSAENVYAPLEALEQADGRVVLMGVGLDKMTLLHLAEQRAGRRLFRRWANGPDGSPKEVEEGGCSRGFVWLSDALADCMTTIQVGDSIWRVFTAQAALQAAAEAIRRVPLITHCGDPSCLECADAIAGGPLV